MINTLKMSSKRKPVFRNSLTNYRNRHIKVAPKSFGRIKRKPTKAELAERERIKNAALLTFSTNQEPIPRPYWMTPLPSPEPVYEIENPTIINEEISTDPIQNLIDYSKTRNRTFNIRRNFNRGTNMQYPWFEAYANTKQRDADFNEKLASSRTMSSVVSDLRRNFPNDPRLNQFGSYGFNPVFGFGLQTVPSTYGSITIHRPGIMDIYNNRLGGLDDIEPD